MPNRRSKRPQGHRQQKVVPLRPVPASAPVPELPAKVGKFAAALWETYWRSDVAGAVDQPDHYALKRWIESVDERERLLKAVQKQTLVEGSTGQPVLNPLTKRLDTLEGQIERFERQFGMTPKARADLGIAAGNAALTAEQLNRMASGDADSEDGEQGQAGTIEGEAEEIGEGFVEA